MSTTGTKMHHACCSCFSGSLMHKPMAYCAAVCLPPAVFARASVHAARSGAGLLKLGGSAATVNLALQQMLAEQVVRERRGGGVASGAGPEGGGSR
jgi:hypothetical protein